MTPFPIIVQFHGKHGEQLTLVAAACEAAELFTSVAQEWLEIGYYEQDIEKTQQLDFFTKPKVSDFDLVEGLLAVYYQGTGLHPSTGKMITRSIAFTELYSFMKRRSEDNYQYETFDLIYYDDLKLQNPNAVFREIFTDCSRELHYDFLSNAQKQERTLAHRERRAKADELLKSRGIDPDALADEQYAMSSRNRYWRDKAKKDQAVAEISQAAMRSVEIEIKNYYDSQKV